MRHLVKKMLTAAGYEVRRPNAFPPGSANRPVGRMTFFIEDLAARGFVFENVLDVGAHNGKWSQTFRKSFPKARFFMIEPKMEMKPDLDRFCQENPGSKWFNCGAGAECGNMILTIWPNAGEGTSFLPLQQPELAERGVQKTVPVRTVDSMIDSGDIPSPDIIKIDVEGFELEVLRGAGKALQTAGLAILEASLYERLPRMPLMHEIISVMADQGFVVYDLPGFHRRPDIGVLQMVDVCFIKRDNPLRPTIRGMYS